MWIKRVLWQNERGMVLILGLLTLLVLGIIGAASTTTSRLEVEIAGNDKTYKEALYAAEIAVVSGEILVDTLTDRVALNEGSVPGRYAKGTKPSWKTSTVWGDSGSTTLSLAALPAGIQENVDATSLPRQADGHTIGSDVFLQAALQHKLLIVPGKSFSSRDTHFRLSYAADDSTLRRGIAVLNELAAQFA